MVYVKRDENNNIIAVFDKKTEDSLEELPSSNKEVITFLNKCYTSEAVGFLKNDLDLIRVIEDLIQILISKNIIAITDFPVAAIEKLMTRNKIRDQYRGISDLMDEYDK